MPKGHVLLYASVAAWIGVAIAQIWGGLLISAVAAVIGFVVVGAGLLARSGKHPELPPSTLLAGGLGGAVLAFLVILNPYGDLDGGIARRMMAAMIPGALLFAVIGWLRLRRSANRSGHER